ncbi:MAG: hypothetical protein V3V92_06640 [Candidatus Hydrothermarchaeales archaeon]
MADESHEFLKLWIKRLSTDEELLRSFLGFMDFQKELAKDNLATCDDAETLKWKATFHALDRIKCFVSNNIGEMKHGMVENKARGTEGRT